MKSLKPTRNSCARKPSVWRNCNNENENRWSHLDELRQAATNAEAAVEAVMQSETNWRGILDRISRSAELSDLLRRQSDVEAAQERLADAQSQAEQIQVTDESLQRIRQAAELADRANAQLRVAATRISFEIPSDRLAGY